MTPAESPQSSPLPAEARRSFAVIVPAYNEADNMPDLFAELSGTFRSHELEGEVVLVDDGSTDGTLTAAREAARAVGFDSVRLLRHRTNRGKTSAIITAARRTAADVLILFDADLQHSTDDIPRFLSRLAEGWDVVAGRKVGPYEKRFVSRIYNLLSRVVFRVPVRDLNAMKAFRREVIEEIHLREDWHRYLVVLAHARGYRISELDIRLFPRRHGESKYGGGKRVVIGFLDLFAVWFQLVFSRKPMLFFGLTGLLLSGLGVVVGLLAVYLRFIQGSGYRPLLTLVVFLVLLGGLLFVAGLVSELIAGLRSEVEELRREIRR